MRRVIATRMSEAKRNIPHFSYVEEIDVTALEALRAHLNSRAARGTDGYTYLPFVVAALTRVLETFPQCNASYDAERNVIVRHHGIHVGIATQTPDGLKVPVVRHAESRSLGELAAEIRRVTEAARSGSATRAELTGSTITVTSLGRLGGIASTPVINSPEVAIIGINKAVERPMVVGGAIAVRRMMNLSSSFDHRFVDGFDAAAMIQALKERLEYPATIFITTSNRFPRTEIMTSTTPQNAPFGTILTDIMAIAWYRNGQWEPSELKGVGPIEIHPAAHVLHYGSECFEGFKAYKWADGSVNVFRMDRHIERLRNSARSLMLPEPRAAQVAEMVTAVIDRGRSAVPDAPGALYLRPLLFGTMPNIGAATTPTDEACLVVLASPVWDYFSAGGGRSSSTSRSTRRAAPSQLGVG